MRRSIDAVWLDVHFWQIFAGCYVCKHRYPHTSNDTPIGTPIMMEVHGLFSSLMDTNQMNEKSRNGCFWSITVTNGGASLAEREGFEPSVRY